MAGKTDRGRRRFLIASAAVGGGMLLGLRQLLHWDPLGDPTTLDTDPGETALNAWLKIGPNETITVAVARAEMGQGVYTSIPMLLADELGADWNQIAVEQSPLAESKIYGNIALFEEMVPFPRSDNGIAARGSRILARRAGIWFGQQVTAGSTSIRDAWSTVRLVGAASREMLISAAARRWKVAASECLTQDSFVYCPATEQRIAFADIAEAAANERAPSGPTLKARADFSVIGQSIPRLDIPDKVAGAATFGIDVKLPGMLVATVCRSPSIGSRVVRVDATRARSMPGVRKVVPIENGALVIAERYWQAHTAARSIEIHEEFENSMISNASIREKLRLALETQVGYPHEETGEVDVALEGSADVVRYRYEAPFLSHACMEPMNCTALIDGDRCEIWAPNQSPTLLQLVASRELKMPVESIKIHTTYMGGGFGRRAESDFVVHALIAASEMPGIPIKLIWSREEDYQHDPLRPAAISDFSIGLADNGDVLAWSNKIAAPSVGKSTTLRNLPDYRVDMPDKTDSDGALFLPYALGVRRVEHVEVDTPVEVGYWRSVGHSYNTFFVESAVDELARHQGRDPLEFRNYLLRGASRESRVLQRLAESTDWNQPKTPGTGRGVAFATPFGSIIAMAVEVCVDENDLSIKQVWSVVDCGVAVHPDNVIAQIEGGIVFGLTAALHGETQISEGRIQTLNFHQDRLLRLPDTPTMHTVILDSGAEVGGIGETSTPLVAPAVANAICDATGIRLRQLPLIRSFREAIGLHHRSA